MIGWTKPSYSLKYKNLSANIYVMTTNTILHINIFDLSKNKMLQYSQYTAMTYSSVGDY